MAQHDVRCTRSALPGLDNIHPVKPLKYNYQTNNTYQYQHIRRFQTNTVAHCTSGIASELIYIYIYTIYLFIYTTTSVFPSSALTGGIYGNGLKVLGMFVCKIDERT